MAAPLRNVSLNDRYELADGMAYMSGLQALARIPIVQRRRDIAAGLNTAGFISGYRGSPLGGLDQQFAGAKKYYDPLNIRFAAGVNEDLAATAIWGTQQVNLHPNPKVDGVFGIWYGKAPGVDRSGDVMRHANAYGTDRKGGVLALIGDDHGCKSSTLPCQSDHVLYAYMIPQLYPASLLEFVEYGLLGIEMSRYSGCWTALKLTSETAETSGTVDLSRENRPIVMPGDDEFEMPPGGLNIRLHDTPRDIDWRLQNFKLFACHAFARKNNIDRTVMDSPKPRFGIITSGKSYGDVRQALIELGITEEVARDIGLRLYKVGMTWPLEPQGVQAFVEGLEEILIVEEKRELIEYQLKQQIYNWDAKRRPVVVGKYDEHRNRLLPLHNDQTVGQVAHVIVQRIKRFYHNDQVERALRFYTDYEDRESRYAPPSVRRPYYCAGCPHNSSTKVPEGSFGMVGIGCHYMVQWMDRNSALCTQMGGEGVPWIGAAPFSGRDHIFANLGDGTYFHSGTLAIRAAVASGVNITYKILYNDAVAMTGGQPVDGELPVERIAQQVMAEGVTRCWIVTENLAHYENLPGVPENVAIADRAWLDKIQIEARETKGCTIIIYDQTCAAEKRRRRKRGKYPDPATRVFINHAVCEGCGDCSKQSNCVAVMPLETEFGRKRQINQSSCNKDYSCLKGICPSFVTIEGGEPRKPAGAKTDAMLADVPLPAVPELSHAYNILVTGIGGTGVLTVGSLLGMAAHLEGKFSRNLDMTGLAQKNGEVLSHIRIAPVMEELRTGHIITGGTDLLLACDIVSAAGKNAHETLNPARTRAIVNTDNAPVTDFVTNNKIDFHTRQVEAALAAAVNGPESHFLNATDLATTLLGDEIATNIFMMGYAWQKGLLPLSLEAILRAVELNGVAVDMNKRAFQFGRLAAHDPEQVRTLAASLSGADLIEKPAETLEDVIARRTRHLTAYQDEAYAARYLDLVEKIRRAETALFPDSTALTEAAARNYHKLLAYKDEYEVARLYTNGDFSRELKARFTGKYKIRYHMSPPLFARTDPATGRPKKYAIGPALHGALAVMAKFRFLRGTPFDIFGYHKDRRTERALIREYETAAEMVLRHLSPGTFDTCAALLAIPDDIRGFGPVKEENIHRARAKQAYIAERLKNPAPLAKAA